VSTSAFFSKLRGVTPPEVPDFTQATFCASPLVLANPLPQIEKHKRAIGLGQILKEHVSREVLGPLCNAKGIVWRADNPLDVLRLAMRGNLWQVKTV